MYNGQWIGNKENLLATYSIAFPEEREAGRDWYLKANMWAGRVANSYGLPTELVINITAQLSPNNNWKRNKTDTTLLIDLYNRGERDARRIKCCTYNNNVDIAIAMMDVFLKQGVIFNPIGTKVVNFAHNIANPQAVGEEVVTIDKWMLRAWMWNTKLHVTISDPMYNRCAADCIDAAYEVGECPRDFQAITWLAVRRAGNYGRGRQPCGLDRLYRQMVLL